MAFSRSHLQKDKKSLSASSNQDVAHGGASDRGVSDRGVSHKRSAEKPVVSGNTPHSFSGNTPHSFSGNTPVQNAFLGAGSQVVGNIVFHGPAVLGGKLEGEVRAEQRLEIGESAVVDANIDGVDVVVRGVVHGNVTATAKLQLYRTGRILGDVACGALHVEDGAVFEGTCRMLNRSPKDRSLSESGEEGKVVKPIGSGQSELAGADLGKGGSTQES